MGVVMVVASLASAKDHHSHQQGGGKKIFIGCVAGVMLFNIMSLLDMLSLSLFAKASETGLSYDPPNAADPSGLYVKFAIYVVMLVGLAGVIHGCVLLKRSAEDGRQTGPALTHLVGGTMAVNIVSFLHMLGDSMGTSVSSVVNAMVGGT
jgi:hypothetical protein